MSTSLSAPPRRVHPVSLFLTPKHKPVPLVARRDQHAALEIVPQLLRRGYDYGEPILDYPPLPPLPASVRRKDLYKVDLSFTAPGDRLLQNTRPPMHDRLDESRKRIRQSFTDLEDRMFDVWEDYVSWSSRGRVLLHERLHPLLKSPHDMKRQIWFREALGAPYKKLSDCGRSKLKTDEDTERRTAVFLLHKEEAWPGGPGLIGAFGMDGMATAVWCYRLGRDLNHLLDKPGFVMAEMTNPGFSERPTNMLCARNWKIEILLHCPEG